MLGENLKTLRKQKGYSQETLAEQLNVVRQTVSKWEKGYSVPDAEMLERIANIFEVPVTALLGSSVPEGKDVSEIDEVVKQLAILNEQMAKQSRSRKRMCKIILITSVIILLVVVIIPLTASLAAFSLYSSDTSTESTTTVELYCSLDGEEYLYEITYDDQYRIISAGGDEWIADHVQTEQYSDANILMAQIEDYFTDRGGTFEIR